ncbi:serine/threonine-protein kinase [Actinomadura viridis]|uniref:serine/threonine-protein kinase n=1 Tax=Actinomadura viridis TaxID=58110 RepID=UPI0036B40ACC
MRNPAELRADDPRTIGPYRLVALLGEGGQGTVYLGEDEAGARVAVKTLHVRLAGDERARRLFLRESAVAREVEPYCTARVLAADVVGDRPYIVSEYVEGESLSDLVRRTGPRDHGSLERLAIGTAAALKGIHRAGIVHRDFKPSNVLLSTDGPRVIDFGIARALTATTTLSSGIVGTPAYMSPEQVAGGDIGPPSDVFSWAVTLTFAATGGPVFGTDGIPAVLHRVLHVDPDLSALSALPENRRDLLAACLDKAPERRPTMSEVLAELLGDAPARATTPPPGTVPPASVPPESARPGSASPYGSHPSYPLPYSPVPPAYGSVSPAGGVPGPPPPPWPTTRPPEPGPTHPHPPGEAPDGLRPLGMGTFFAGTLLQVLVGVALVVYAFRRAPDLDALIAVQVLILVSGCAALLLLRLRAGGNR